MYIQTISNDILDFSNPSAFRPKLDDIITVLPRVKRFNGHSDVTLESHSIWVASFLQLNRLQICKDYKLDIHFNHFYSLIVWGLFHDAHEVYTGDIVTPLKDLVRSRSGTDPIRDLENSLDAVISEHVVKPNFDNPEYQFLGLDFVNQYKHIIKLADVVAFVYERVISGFDSMHFKAPLPDTIDWSRYHVPNLLQTTCSFGMIMYDLSKKGFIHLLDSEMDMAQCILMAENN